MSGSGLHIIEVNLVDERDDPRTEGAMAHLRQGRKHPTGKPDASQLSAEELELVTKKLLDDLGKGTDKTIRHTRKRSASVRQLRNELLREHVALKRRTSIETKETSPDEITKRIKLPSDFPQD